MTIADTYQTRLRQLDERCEDISVQIALVSVTCVQAGLSRDAVLERTRYYRQALRSTEALLSEVCDEIEAHNASTVGVSA